MEGVGEYTALLQRKWSTWAECDLFECMCDFISRCLTLYEVLATGQWGGSGGGGGNHTFIMSPNVFTALVWSCRVVPWSLWCIHSHCDAIYKLLRAK